MKAWLIALCLVACTHTALDGKYFAHSIAKRQSIHRGVTTKQDIATMFGDPYKTEGTGAGETWIYYDREPVGVDGGYADNTMSVKFNAQSVVDNVRYKSKETKSAADTKGPKIGTTGSSTPPALDPILCHQQQQLKLVSPSAPEPTACGY
jgi:outer membrane protein assembly factor BamE (lipoprotein component of BamABCDE complex)